ncbi:hypothetical protein L6R53_25765 [Myxococcota bacterium]|nr:hypothetical protein [Myxococcota bacterium]
MTETAREHAVPNPDLTYWHRVAKGTPENRLSKEELRGRHLSDFPGEYWYEGLPGWTTNRDDLLGYWVRLGSDGCGAWVPLARIGDYGEGWECWWPGAPTWVPVNALAHRTDAVQLSEDVPEQHSLKDAEEARRLLAEGRWWAVRDFLERARSADHCRSRARLLEREGLVDRVEEQLRAGTFQTWGNPFRIFGNVSSLVTPSLHADDTTQVTRWGPLSPWAQDTLDRVRTLWADVLQGGSADPNTCGAAIVALSWADTACQQETPFGWGFNELRAVVRDHGRKWGLRSCGPAYTTNATSRSKTLETYVRHCAYVLWLESRTESDAFDLMAATVEALGPGALSAASAVVSAGRALDSGPKRGFDLLQECLNSPKLPELLDGAWNATGDMAGRLSIVQHAEWVDRQWQVGQKTRSPVVEWFSSKAVAQWLLREPDAWPVPDRQRDRRSGFDDRPDWPVIQQWKWKTTERPGTVGEPWEIAPGVARNVLIAASRRRLGEGVVELLRTLSDIAKVDDKVGETIRQAWRGLPNEDRGDLEKRLRARVNRETGNEKRRRKEQVKAIFRVLGIPY